MSSPISKLQNSVMSPRNIAFQWAQENGCKMVCVDALSDMSTDKETITTLTATNKELLATLKSIHNLVICHGTPKQFKRVKKLLAKQAGD